MTDPSFNQVSQFSHVGWGYLLTTAPALLFHKHVWPFAIPVMVGAAAKECWDAHGGESPIVAGNSWEDFGFWCVGIILALLILH